MSNVTLGVGPGAVDSLALVSVDGVTIVGDGADVPLSAASASFAAAYVNGGALARSRNIAAFTNPSAGVFTFTFVKPPTDPLSITPSAVLADFGSSFNTAGMIRCGVNTDGSGLVTVRTFNSSGALANEDFIVTWSLGLANPDA